MDDLEELLYEKAFIICGCGAALPQTCFPKNGVKNGVQLYRNICGRCNTERVKDAKRRIRNADEAKEAERQENVQVCQSFQLCSLRDICSGRISHTKLRYLGKLDLNGSFILYCTDILAGNELSFSSNFV